MKTKNLILFLLILFIGCNSRNRLKTDEKSLAKQILTEEQQRNLEDSLRAEREKKLADSIAKLPKGFRFKEDRSVDADFPPVIIDIAGNRENPQKIKLSNLFKKVEYIQLEPDPDSSFIASGFRDMVVGDKHIYGFSFQAGVVQFGLDGKFIGFVCRNNLPVSRTPDGAPILMTSDPATKMAWQIFYADGKLCYKYLNRENQTTSYYQFDDGSDCSETLVLPTQEGEKAENKPQGTKYAQFSDKFVSKSTTLYLLAGGMKAQVQNRKPVSEALPFVSVLSTNGDTICTFQDNDPIVNFSKTVYRGVDDGNNYYFNQILHLRQSFNDTIYCLIPPNRLIPKYIFDFGDMGIPSANTGIDPGFDLKDRLILQSLLETDRYLFITYSKDYDCPNTAKSGTLKYSRLIYDKRKKASILIYVDEAPFVREGKMSWPLPPEINIENDLDAMPFKWPESVTANEIPYSIFTGEELMNNGNVELPVKIANKNDRIIAIYH
ncbi:DUF4933 domain-containing protein [uncultured Sunxiuqinia sp.]|uniref:DUF4933 domain-containing protein n=1 Tax=uncultured Sunxiuqinia sp. TaxID=1573825 RepID=UPI002AA882C4|nr:DUF4933 domain-containing protein [uncultured Sunxiuqinia sp.]